MKTRNTSRLAHHLVHDPLEARRSCPQHLVAEGLVKTEDELWHDEALVVAVQNRWHRKGFNGCVFAQAVASKASELGWRHEVIAEEINTDNRKTIAKSIEIAIEKARTGPDVRILSVLFPQVKEVPHLVDVTRLLVSDEVPSVFLVNKEVAEGHIALSLRISISESKQLGWIMGFGPFDFFPNSRHSPVTEIVIPVKPKPASVFHRHSHDQSAAHVADIPTNLDDSVMEHLWHATHSRTRYILHGEPNQFSAARTTFTLPITKWVDWRDNDSSL